MGRNRLKRLKFHSQLCVATLAIVLFAGYVRISGSILNALMLHCPERHGCRNPQRQGSDPEKSPDSTCSGTYCFQNAMGTENSFYGIAFGSCTAFCLEFFGKALDMP